MSMSISSSAASLAAGSASSSSVMSPERQALRQLGRSLKAGDLDGAKQAYASMIKNAPAAASWNGDSPFAQVGKALRSGDVEAAQTAFGTMLKTQVHKHPIDTSLPPATPITPSTDSIVGTSVNLVA